MYARCVLLCQEAIDFFFFYGSGDCNTVLVVTIRMSDLAYDTHHDIFPLYDGSWLSLR